MAKELKKTDKDENPIDQNENQELKNKKGSGLLKGLTGYLKKHFLDKKNYADALKLTHQILENTPLDNKKNVFNMIKSTFDGYEANKNETVESDIKNNTR